MLNRNKKKAIVEWMNCLCGNYPIECLAELKNGYHFYNLARKINQVNEESEVPDVLDERYAYVENCLNEFYQAQISSFMRFSACKKGNEEELAKLTILLLSALVHFSLTTRDEQVYALTMLEQHVQEDIHQCISAVLLNSNNCNIELSPTFAQVLMQQTEYSSVDVSTSPRKKSISPSCSQTPKIEKRCRGRPPLQTNTSLPSTPVQPMESSLRVLLDSPQILAQITLREKDKKLKSLQYLLHDVENKCSDLEIEKQSLNEVLDKKEKEIADLKKMVIEMRNDSDNADDLIAKSQTGEPKPPELLECMNCSSLQKSLEELDKEYNKLDEELRDTKSKLDAECVHNNNIMKETTELRGEIHELNSNSAILQQEISELKTALSNSEESLNLIKVKYEDAVNELNQLKQLPVCLTCEKHAGESMEIVPEKRIEELEEQILKNEKLIADQQIILTERGKYILTLEEERNQLMLRNMELKGEIDCQSPTLAMIRQQLEHVNTKLKDENKRRESLEEQLNFWKDTFMSVNPRFSLYMEKEKEKGVEVLKDYVNSISQLDNQLQESIKENQVLSDKLKQLDNVNASLVSECSNLQSELCKLQSKLEDDKKSMADLAAAIENLKRQCETLTNKNIALEHEETTLQEQVSILKNEVEGKDNEFSTYKDSSEGKIRDLQKQVISLSEELKKCEANLQVVQQQKDELVEKDKDLTKQLEQAKQCYNELEQQKEAEGKYLQEQLDKAKDNYDCQVANIAELKDNFNEASKKITVLSQTVIKKEEEINDIRKSSEETIAQLHAEAHRNSIEFASKKTSLEDQLQKLKDKCVKAKAENKSMCEQMQRLHQDNSDLQNKERNLVNELEKCNCQLEELKQEKAEMKEKIQELESNLKDSVMELCEYRHYKELVMKIEEDNAIFKARMHEHLCEIDVLKTLNKNFEQENEKLRAEIKNTTDSFNNKLVQSESNVKCAQMHADRIQLDCEKEVQCVKAELQKINSEKSALQSQVEALKAENEKLQEQSIAKESVPEVVAELETKNVALTQQIESLNCERENLQEQVSLLQSCSNAINEIYSSFLQIWNEEKQANEIDEVVLQGNRISRIELLVSELSGENLDNQTNKNGRHINEIKILKDEIQELTSLLNSLFSTVEKHKKVLDQSTLVVENMEQYSKSELVAEREQLYKKIDELEQNYSVLRENKELAEKDHFTCMEDKDGIILNLRRQVYALQKSIKSGEDPYDSKNSSCSELSYFQLKESFRSSFISLDLDKANKRLLEENNELKQEQKKWEKELELMRNEMKDLSKATAKSNAQRDQIIKDHQLQLKKIQAKYERAKEVILKLEQDKKELEKQLKLTLKNEEHIHEATLWSKLQKSKKCNSDLQIQLQQTANSLSSLQTKVEELERLNSEMKEENKALSAQLDFANNQLRRLGKQTEQNKDITPRRKKRFTSSRVLRSPALSSLKEQHSVLLKKGREQHYVRKHTTKNVTETIYHKISSNDISDSLNGSLASEGFSNKSALGTTHFQCDDEEEYFDSGSLISAQSFDPAAPSTSHRLSELQKRNSLCPPHMRSSYPVETQMLPSSKFPDEIIKTGDEPQAKSETASAGMKSPKHAVRKRKYRASSVSLAPEPKKVAKSDLERAHSTPSNAGEKRFRNPFPSPKLITKRDYYKIPTSVSKIMAFQWKLLSCPKTPGEEDLKPKHKLF